MQVTVAKHKGQWKWRIKGTDMRRSFSPPILATRENYPIAVRQAGQIEDQLKRQVEDVPVISSVFAAYQADRTNNKHAKYAWVALGPFWGHLTVDEITRDKCREYVAMRRSKGIKDGTIRRELTDLKSAVNWHSKHNNAVFELPPVPAARERWLTRQEFAKLYEAAQSDHLKLFMRLAVATAGRKEALLDLRWEKGPGVGYVDFNAMQIVLGNKQGGKGRATVPISSVLEAELRAARGQAYTEYVIEYQGNAVSDIKKAFAAAVKRAGIDHCTPHDLRRTAAIWMVQAGHPMEAVAQYLGHSNASITYRVYARYQKDYLQDLAETLNV